MTCVNMCTFLSLAVAFLVFPGPSCTNSDNLGLLLDTLKMIQRTVCDDEMVSLACPRGTSISIQVAQYGNAAPEDQGCIAETEGSQTTEDDPDKKCKRPNSMQYSLLQKVVEVCQKKPQCKFSTKPKQGLVDPCPFARKYVEVAYKCRPYEFRSRTACEGEIMKLSCNPNSRIVIFDAQYGRNAYEPVICSLAKGAHNQSCVAPYAVETTMQLCHGKRRCQIAANSKTFESSCYSRPYLKVIYTCVRLGVLTERFESAAEKDEIVNGITENDDKNEDLFDESDGDAGEKWGEPNINPALHTSPQVELVTPPFHNDVGTTGTVSKTNIDRNKGTSYRSYNTIIYIFVGIVVLVIIVTIAFGVRCYLNSRATENSKNGDMFTTEAPNVFNDAVSDLDNDVDISHISGTFYDPVHPDMILYKDVPGSKGTLRAMKPLSTIYPCAGASMYGNVDYVPTLSRDVGTRFTRSRSKEEAIDPEAMTSPRSLGTYSNSHYYYG